MAHTDSDHADSLFANLAEQIKLPLTQIAYEAELLNSNVENPTVAASTMTIGLTSHAALRLIDGYLLSIALQREGRLELEPVSISSVLYDVAEVLNTYATSFDCKLELHIAGKYGPVMAHQQAMRLALVSLGYSFIDAASIDEKSSPTVKLSVRKNAKGIATGIFANTPELNRSAYERAGKLQGIAHQPLAGLGTSNGAGIFVADRLFEQLQAPLRVSHLQGTTGLAATLSPSRQLNLV